ncbi:MAG: ABC transporter substrate-binding protein [Balneolales bacterium]
MKLHTLLLITLLLLIRLVTLETASATGFIDSEGTMLADEPRDESSDNADEEELFQKGMEFYQTSRYDSAAVLFSGLDLPEARLFAGKSYFALSNYPLAHYYLGSVRGGDDPRLLDEAGYTLALVYFKTGQFGRSLDLLYSLKSRPAYQNLHREAGLMYEQIMDYLTIYQRKRAFDQSGSNPVRFDLFRYGLEYMNRSEAEELFQTLHSYYHASVDTHVIEAVERRIQRLPEVRNDTIMFGQAPSGKIYNIGVMLPATQTGSQEWQISRSLYNGYLLAAEEFNREHDNKHIRLHHIETSDTALTEEAAITRLAWRHHVDAVLGPLFSNSAYRIRDLAEFYEMPLIPPLANSDTLNIHNPYLYQINPTFETRGISMARFAVNTLKLDTLAVITQRNMPVEREAHAFRIEAERLGATVLHFFNEDFDARAFEVDHITPWFAEDDRFMDEEEGDTIKPVQGLYLSVTGRGAGQLIDLILNDLQAFRSNAIILGNEEMAHIELSNARRRYFDIYYSNFFYSDPDQRESYNFRNNFESLAGYQPDNFAHLGYDVATFLFTALDDIQNPARIKPLLRHRPPYEGLITKIDFQGTHVNHHLHILRIGLDETILYEYMDDEITNGDENGNNDDTR